MRKIEVRPILSLRPTQFCFGVEEIEGKIAKLMSKSPEARGKYLLMRPVPVVKAPNQEFYLIDRHHLAFACWSCGVQSLRVSLIEDFSTQKLNMTQFWRMMEKKKWTHLYDQFGEGPRDPIYLPRDIRGLADDPYRSLAWLVRKKGGFKNSTIPYAEFKWAAFFRKKKLLSFMSREELMLVLPEALNLARSPKAKRLPGYKGPSIKG